MSKRFWASSALAAAALTLAGPALAVSSATAKLTGFSITLYDLDPGDGIAPGISFTGETSYVYTGVSSAIDNFYDNDSQPGNFAPTSATSMSAYGEASAATDAVSATTSGWVSGPGDGSKGYFSADAHGIERSFTLTPWTAMKLTATVDATASTGPAGTHSESAWGEGYLVVTSGTANGNEQHYASGHAFAGCGSWDGSSCSGESNSYSGTVSLSFANLSDAGFDGQMIAGAFASGQSLVPVPEPQAYLMLLAGLAGVGAVVRRRTA